MYVVELRNQPHYNKKINYEQQTKKRIQIILYKEPTKSKFKSNKDILYLCSSNISLTPYSESERVNITGEGVAIDSETAEATAIGEMSEATFVNAGCI